MKNHLFAACWQFLCSVPAPLIPIPESKKSPKQPGEQVSELRQEPVSALWPAVRKVP